MAGWADKGIFFFFVFLCLFICWQVAAFAFVNLCVYTNFILLFKLYFLLTTQMP